MYSTNDVVEETDANIMRFTEPSNNRLRNLLQHLEKRLVEATGYIMSTYLRIFLLMLC